MFLILTALVVLLLFYNYYWKRRDYPTGPPPLPLVGNLLSLASTKRFEHKFVEWKKKYGTIYTYWVGETPFVTINDANLAHQMFVKDGENYVDRGENMSFQIMLGEKTVDGVLMTNGQLWQDQRRFTLKFLRDFGLGKNEMQERILEEIHNIIKNVNKDLDSGVVETDFFKHTDLSIGSIINSLIFGYRFTQDGKEDEFNHLKELTIKTIGTLTNPLVFFAFFNKPLEKWIRRIFPHFYQPIRDFFDFFENQINQRVKTEEIDENMEPRDFVDAFLIEKTRQKRLGLPTADFYTLRQLRGLAFDMWFGGQETTSNSINWAIADLIVYPSVQEKIHKELDSVIGSDRIITVSDRQQLNYLNAFIMEVLRSANVVPQNAIRLVAKDVEVNGVKIKKGSFCMAQVSTLHYDPEIFPNPDIFKPERFLDKNGQLIQNEASMPFSLGKRACPGEGLAKMELFLFIANLCNQYKFFAGKKDPVLEKPNGGATAMIPYKCVIEKRFTQ